MQKAYSLQPEELQQSSSLEQEHQNLLADYGAMQLKKKRILKRLPEIENEQRNLIRAAVQRLGVDNFNAARIDGTNLILDVPDQQPQPMMAVPGPAGRHNGQE